MKSFPMKALIVLLPLCALVVKSEATQTNFQLRRIVTVLETIVDDLTADEAVASEEPLSPSDEPVFSADVNIEPVTSAEADTEGTDSIAPDSPYELTIIDPKGVDPTSVVILLHAINSSVAEILPIVQTTRFALPTTRFVLPQASVKLVDFVNQEIPAWYDVPSLDPTVPEAKDEIEQAAQNIADIAAIQQLELGIGAHKITIVGVSQGGSVALTAYLRYAWAGVVTLSAYLPIRTTYPAELTADSAIAPLLMMHGTTDELVPPFVAKGSADFIKTLGRNVEYIEFDGAGHSLEHALGRAIAAATAALQAVLL